MKQNQASYHDYCERVKEEDGIVLYGFKKYKDMPSNDEQYVDACFSGLSKEYRECEKINKAFYERKRRLKNRVSDILTSGPSVFLTLTFRDDVLQSTNEKERRVLVSRFLKKHDAKYVANIDFGAKNHREHYHALINVPKIQGDEWTKKCGDIDFKTVRLKKDLNNDIEKLSKYVAKLTNHAIKETTRRSALIYSR